MIALGHIHGRGKGILLFRGRRAIGTGSPELHLAVGTRRRGLGDVIITEIAAHRPAIAPPGALRRPVVHFQQFATGVVFKGDRLAVGVHDALEQHLGYGRAAGVRGDNVVRNQRVVFEINRAIRRRPARPIQIDRRQVFLAVGSGVKVCWGLLPTFGVIN